MYFLVFEFFVNLDSAGGDSVIKLWNVHFISQLSSMHFDLDPDHLSFYVQLQILRMSVLHRIQGWVPLTAFVNM